MDLDKIGEILWFSMFLTPLVTIPVVWMRGKGKIINRILLGLFWAVIISGIFFIISWSIFSRDGLGPT